MVGRKKKAKLCDEDLIRHLPEDLISEILTHLPTKEAVRTSVLTTKWRNLWSCVPVLDLDSCAFTNLDAFVSFVEKFFESQRDPWIPKLKLSIHYPNTDSFLTSWIDVVTKRRIQQLNVYCEGPHSVVNIPVMIYTCQTLVELKLSWVVLPEAEFVSLPCLKTMHLECVRYLNENILEKLIESSPVLEDVTIIRRYDIEKAIHVRSKSLKRLDINEYTQVVIEAPLLQCLTTRIFSARNFHLLGSGFPAKLDIDVVSRNAVCARSFIFSILTNVSRVRDLVISSLLLKDIILSSEYRPMPLFDGLTRLNAKFSKLELEILPKVLENSPKLESLILEVVKDPRQRMNREPYMMFPTVPSCLVTSLKYVELKRLTSSFKGEIDLVRYFLKHSTILEKLKLDTHYSKKTKSAFLKEVIAMPRSSSACEVLVL